MKKTIFTLLMIIGLQFVISKTSFAQWQTEVRLTNDPMLSLTSINNAKCIAANGDFIHIVWYDGVTVGEGNWEIYYKRSTNRGLTWSANLNLTNDEYLSYNPAIAVSGTVVHVVWYDNSNGPGNYEIFYKRSLDNGVTWDAAVQLSNTTGRTGHPSISVSGSNVHVVWWDTRDGVSEIYYKKSIDGGNNWSADLRLSNTAGLSWNPAVAVSGLNVHVVWYDSTAGNWEIYYKRSIDGGLNWGADTRLTNNTAISTTPTLAVSGSTVHVAWSDSRNGTYNIYYKRSTNSGSSWSSDTRITKNNYYNNYPSIAINGSIVHIVYERLLTTSYDIFYISSNNNGAKWGNDIQLTKNSSMSSISSIAVSGTYLHTIFRDNRDGNSEIYYKQFKGTAYSRPTGITNNNLELIKTYSMSQNYPNPFNPVTKISFSVPNEDFVSLKVFDPLGREVATLVNEVKSPGIYSVDFHGAELPSGVYFYRLQSGEFTDIKKMTLIK